VGAVSDDVATDCDHCHGDILYGETAYSVKTGATDEGRDVVRIICARCYWQGHR
jgi:hypothetical protein